MDAVIMDNAHAPESYVNPFPGTEKECCTPSFRTKLTLSGHELNKGLRGMPTGHAYYDSPVPPTTVPMVFYHIN